MNWRRKKDLKRKLLNLLQGKPRKNIFVNKRKHNVHLLYLSKVKMKSKSQKNSLLQTIAMIPSSQTKTLCPIMMMTSCSGHRHKSNLTTWSKESPGTSWKISCCCKLWWRRRILVILKDSWPDSKWFTSNQQLVSSQRRWIQSTQLNMSKKSKERCARRPSWLVSQQRKPRLVSSSILIRWTSMS